MRNTANREIRRIMSDCGLRYWVIAEALGVSENTFCRWMRTELTPERRARVMSAIDVLSQRGGSAI